ncbi:tRNA uridine 5-carboxymethylaminomethyl modification enzyme MnmG [Striga asiatica]|uniref:tRNA uridine 5-carboxymethylaminomethyl modification enzyme MnmG n=1 Tax=Striga asiatica TaxID=4170 RepID=A0A5A7Q699_STRAF|nr:tRNA uridine 5-carboxymethylaminomethyl modification enzyme MnmG [Striga asiatica]
MRSTATLHSQREATPSLPTRSCGHLNTTVDDVPPTARTINPEGRAVRALKQMMLLLVRSPKELGLATVGGCFPVFVDTTEACQSATWDTGLSAFAPDSPSKLANLRIKNANLRPGIYLEENKLFYSRSYQMNNMFTDIPRDMVDYFTAALELKRNKIVGTQLDLLHPSALLDVEMLQSKRPKQADRMRSSAPSSRVTLLNLIFRRDILVCNLGKHGQV